MNVQSVDADAQVTQDADEVSGTMVGLRIGGAGCNNPGFNQPEGDRGTPSNAANQTVGTVGDGATVIGNLQGDNLRGEKRAIAYTCAVWHWHSVNGAVAGWVGVIDWVV
jgi:hypothetical protein